VFERLRTLIAAGPAGADSGSANGKITLREVLRRNWEELWYQPKIDLRSKRLVGAEGLIRARRPDDSVISPAQFLPGAQDDEVLVLTERVILAALRDFEDCASVGVSVKLSVNVPVSALVKLPIAQILREERPKSPSWPGLTLEITEDEALKDFEITSDVAEELRALDCTLALDDFGAGFSSLARLRQLPFSELKIDRSYVTNCHLDHVNAGLCATIVDLGKRFGLKTVAEGVETMQACKKLQDLGCEVGQGYLFAMPMSKAAFLGALGQRMIGGPRSAVQSLSAPAKLLRGLFADA
jgi:EAL domain-containing protein (putative c-di-GMP-specific phosphodiesterase class I)